MRTRSAKRLLSLLLTLVFCLGLLPGVTLSAAAADASDVQPTDFKVFPFTSPVSDPEGGTPITTIDLSQNIYAYSPNGCQMSGLCLWRVDSVDSTAAPTQSVLNSVYYSQRDGDRFGDGLYTVFSGSMSGAVGYSTYSNSSHNTLYYGYGDNTGGYDFDTQSFYCNAGFPLLYRSGGSNQTQYIQPGYYRFVMYYGGTLYYSSTVYTVTDTQGIAGSQGVFDVRYLLGDSEVTSVGKGSEGLGIEMSNFRLGGWTADSAETLTESDIASIDLITVGGLTNYEAFTSDYRRWAPETDSSYGELTVSNGTLLLSGVTLPDGYYDYRVKVTTADGRVYLCDRGLHAVAVAPETTITTSSIPTAYMGTAFSTTLSGTSADSGALSWSVSGGSLPAGLTLSEAGVLSGTPTENGRFSFTVTAAAGDSSSATRGYTMIVSKLSQYGYWSAAVTPAQNLRGAETSYDFTVKPSVTATPTAGSSVTVTLPSGVLQDGSAVAVSTPAAGVSGAVDAQNNTVTLSFDGNTPIPAETGIVFTVTGVVNPDSISLEAAVRSDRWEDLSTVYSMNSTSASCGLIDAGGANVTIADWDDYKYMDLRLVVTVNSGETTTTSNFTVNRGTIGLDTLGIRRGDPFTITLEARDALYAWHTYAVYEGTGDGAANVVTLTPAPAAGDALTGYVLVKTLGGAPNAAANSFLPTLYKDYNALHYRGDYDDGGDYICRYWLSDAEGLRATTLVSFDGNLTLRNYDRDGSTVTADAAAGTLTVDYPLLSMNASLTGTVTDEDDGSPIPCASVVASQNVNGYTVSFNAVTDRNGVYSLPSLYAGKPLTLTAWAEGYGETSVELNADTAEQVIALPRVGRIIVAIGDGRSVTNPSFTLSGSGYYRSYSFRGDSTFTLDLPRGAATSDGSAYTIRMTSDDTLGTVSAPAVFSEGSATAVLQPTRPGVLDWTGLEGAGYNVLICRGADLIRTSSGPQRCSLPAGTYTVYLSASYQQGDSPAGSYADFTVTSGETTEVTGITPPVTERAAAGGVTGPASAANGELYKVSAVLESEIAGPVNAPFSYLQIDLSNNTSLVGATINGTYVSLSSGAGYSLTVQKNDFPSVDWTFPLNCTLYLYQRTEAGESQSVQVRAGYGDYSAILGSVATKSVQGISLFVPARVGAQRVSTAVNDAARDFLQPEPFEFSGIGLPDADVRLYDNDTLIAIARADWKGSYSGTAYLADTSYAHVLRAEQGSGEGPISASAELSYDPTGPILTALTLRLSSTDYPLSISGAPTAYTATATASYQYLASFRNEDRLEDLTLPNPAAVSAGDPETLTGKVFFRVSTAGGEYLLPAAQTDGIWQSEVVCFGANYPTGVQVIYRGAENASQQVSVPLLDGSGESVTVDHGYVLYNADGTSDPVTATTQTDLYGILGLNRDEIVDADWELDYPEWSPEDPNGWLPVSNSVLSSATDGYSPATAQLMANNPSLSSLFENIANTINADLTGDLSDENGEITRVSTITGQNASASGKDGLTMEIRTWIDQPTWTKAGVNWRVEELRGSGYKVSSATYEDYQYLYFAGTFYYDKYGKPSSLTRTVNAMGGVPVTEPNPDMYSRTTGEMIGSALKVEYIYSVKEGKWMRCQTAMIAPKATSPIHLAANQVPNATTPPYRYTDAAELQANRGGTSRNAALLEQSEYFSPAEASVYATLMASTPNRKGGMSWGVKLDKVQDSTYAGMAISATGYLGTKWVGASKNLKTLYKYGDDRQIVEVGNQLFVQGEYKITLEESIVTGIAIGEGAAISGKETKFGDIGGIREQLLANYKYYSDLEGNSTYAYRASLGKKETKELLEALGDVEYAIEMAGVQDAFTQNVTSELTVASGFIGLFGGPIGAEASLCIDLYSTFLKAANDTNNADVKEAVERLLQRVDGYKASDSERKAQMKAFEQEKKDYNNEMGFPIYSVDNNVFNDPFDANRPSQPTAQTTPVHDPSGIIFEGVIENPVPDAMVTLWTYDPSASGMVLHDDSAYLGQANPVTSDEKGFYRWDVPEGEWYVTAEKAGYAAGSSGQDSAATIARTINEETVNFLPVLPVQLNVNIPLVDPAAPTVTDVQYTTDGIFVTFSKYMTEGTGAASVLDPANYTLVSGDTALTVAGIFSAEQGHAPANVDPQETTYTRTVQLQTAETLTEGTPLTLTVAGTVTSYALTPLGDEYAESGLVRAQEQLPQPDFYGTDAEGGVISGTAPSASLSKGSTVSILLPPGAPAGAAIYYTTDGSAPTKDSLRYDEPVTITGNMVIRAAAICSAWLDSEVSVGTFTLAKPAEPPVTPEPEPEYWDEEDTEPSTPQTPDKTETPAEPERPFTDVAETNWFFEAVYYCYDKGYFKGTSEKEFTPGDTMTREMFAAVLYRIAGEPELEGEKNAFSDVAEGKYYTDAVLWASGEGIILGYGDGSFGTGDPVTREQMVVLFWRLSGEPEAEGADLSAFTDAGEIHDWAREAFAWAVSAGIVRGKGNGILDPKGDATRAEVAQIVMNYDTIINAPAEKE